MHTVLPVDVACTEWWRHADRRLLAISSFAARWVNMQAVVVLGAYKINLTPQSQKPRLAVNVVCTQHFKLCSDALKTRSKRCLEIINHFFQIKMYVHHPCTNSTAMSHFCIECFVVSEQSRAYKMSPTYPSTILAHLISQKPSRITEEYSVLWNVFKNCQHIIILHTVCIVFNPNHGAYLFSSFSSLYSVDLKCFQLLQQQGHLHQLQSLSQHLHSYVSFSLCSKRQCHSQILLQHFHLRQHWHSSVSFSLTSFPNQRLCTVHSRNKQITNYIKMWAKTFHSIAMNSQQHAVENELSDLQNCTS